MPPRSVCLNVFTSSLGDAVRGEEGGQRQRHPIMDRRDSAQSGELKSNCFYRGSEAVC
jgi:hypothetical protein